MYQIFRIIQLIHVIYAVYNSVKTVIQILKKKWRNRKSKRIYEEFEKLAKSIKDKEIIKFSSRELFEITINILLVGVFNTKKKTTCIDIFLLLSTGKIYYKDSPYALKDIRNQVDKVIFDRGGQYDNSKNNLETLSKIWGKSKFDCCIMMCEFKLARLMSVGDEGHFDSYLDLYCYLKLAYINS